MADYFEPLGYRYINYPFFRMWGGHQKPSVPLGISKLKTPTDFFSIMWTSNIWSTLLGKKNFTSKTRKESYLSEDTLKRFFGMILMKGVIGMVSVDDFWAQKFFKLDFDGKSEILPRNVFFEISNNLIFDPKQVYDTLIGNFQRHLCPGYFVTVDEIRIPSRHHDCEEKKYNPKKPDVWAIESKSLNDSSKYLLHFIYPLGDDIPTPKESVYTFAKYLKTTKRNHHITLDSNFLSANDIPLRDEEGEDMMLETTVSCKKNRPTEIWKELQEKLPRGYTRVVSNDDMVAACTYNNGFVNLASNLFQVFDNEELYEPHNRRMLLDIYDKTKGYSDDFGHLVKAYWPDEKFRNYEMALLVGWLVYATTNAWILYSFKFDAVSHREFQFQIARDLLFCK